MNSPSSFPVFLFDFDGTLADTRPAICWSLSTVFKEAGLPQTEKETILAAISKGWSLDESLRYLHPQLEKKQESLAEITKRYRQLYATEGYSQMKPYQGAGLVLETLKDRNSTLYLVSNKGINALEQAFKLWQWDHLFDAILADGAFPERPSPLKPDSTSFDKFIYPLWGEKKEEYLMVGDTATDYFFAQNCGVPFCHVRYGYGEASSFKGAPPTYCISTLSELL